MRNCITFNLCAIKCVFETKHNNKVQNRKALKVQFYFPVIKSARNSFMFLLPFSRDDNAMSDVGIVILRVSFGKVTLHFPTTSLNLH